MATRLEIQYDGTVPGLKDHRLSLSAFGPSLNALLRALRRIATNMVGDALASTDVARGRLKASAKHIDIEIAAIKEGSSGIEGLVTLTSPPGGQMPLLSDLTDRAMQEFLESIQLEARGTLRNSGVRSYLQSLPAGITKHTYTYHNTNSSKTVTLESMSLASLTSLPSVREIIGLVVGVGFEPGKNEIRLRHPEGKAQFIFSANQDQINSALQLRGKLVRILGLIGDQNRVLRLESADSERYRPTPEDRERLIFGRWHNVLTELAR